MPRFTRTGDVHWRSILGGCWLRTAEDQRPAASLPDNIVLFGDGREIGRALAGLPFDAARVVVLHVGDEGER